MIGENGENLGVMETSEALKIAQKLGLYLIEIAANAKPPVCKIMDFGKFKYEREKGERAHGSNQKEVEVKGIRIGFTTGQHDLQMRAQQALKFLDEGDRVRIQMKLVGRQKAHGDLAFKKFNDFLSIIPVEIVVESLPKRFPQGIIAVINKKSAKPHEKSSAQKN